MRDLAQLFEMEVPRLFPARLAASVFGEGELAFFVDRTSWSGMETAELVLFVWGCWQEKGAAHWVLIAKARTRELRAEGSEGR